MVVAPIVGNPARRKARCKRLSDQVAVWSATRSGCRCTVCTTWVRASAAEVGFLPRPLAITRLASPRWLNRSTSCDTPSRERPACRPAWVKPAPAATASRALARLTASTRSALSFGHTMQGLQLRLADWAKGDFRVCAHASPVSLLVLHAGPFLPGKAYQPTRFFAS
jgi:hypothetical protein